MPQTLQVLLSQTHEHGAPLVAVALDGKDLAELVEACLGANRSHRLGWALGQAAQALGADRCGRWRWTGRNWIEVL